MTLPDAYSGLEPAEVWRHFAELNNIPRPSGSEAAARAYVGQVGTQGNLQTQTDGRGNIVLRLPATKPELEGAEKVAIQSHLDMVCEKRPDVRHDFAVDPIRPVRDGDFIRAAGTTLGADNGIGAALMLAVATTPGLEHGPVELLFTVEEETGLFGAKLLDPTMLQARLLINLDSEDPEEITIGCAGGAGAALKLTTHPEVAPGGYVGMEVIVSGLKGGHSGVQIHEPLANAIKLLTGALVRSEAQFHLASINGGNAHNAIPRDARAVVAVPAHTEPEFESAIAAYRKEQAAVWATDEPGFTLETRPVPVPAHVMTRQNADDLLQLLSDLPHGVLVMSEVFPGKVETSSNLAEVRTADSTVEIATSTRSFRFSEIQRVQAEIRELGEEACAEITMSEGYPGWEPNATSKLLKAAEEVYTRVHGHPALVQVVHAGLECGVIADKIPGMEAISFGPYIRGAHTPEEHVEPKSVGLSWSFLTALLAELSKS